MSAPPPAYSASSYRHNFSNTATTTTTTAAPSLLTLPDHLLLAILSHLSLPHLVFTVRPTCTRLSLFASHLLRRQLFPIYSSKLRPGYSTDAASLSSTSTPNRETRVLDQFIAACAYEARQAEESSLLLLPSASTSAERDLFEFLQPRARVEDLLLKYAKQDKIVYGGGVWEQKGGGTIQEDDVTVQLGTRTANVLLPFKSVGGESRGISTVPRSVMEVSREGVAERLEQTAEKLVAGLATVRVWREEGLGEGGKRVAWYERG